LANSAKNEQCSISECVDLLLYQADGLARKQGVEIVREIPDALNEQVFSSDQAKFRQMLGLIIDNAIRYNRPNGKVSLAVNQAAPDSLVFTVTDTGCGLSEDQLKALGEPFVRYGETERIAGTGLGLALAYRLATLLGAEISVSSVPGAGTVFSVKLPL
jgi:signal transduction histidine kinase